MNKQMKWQLSVAILAIGTVLSGCSSGNAENAVESKQPQASESASAPAATQQQQAQAIIKLDQEKIVVTNWKLDNSHVVSITGKVLVDGKPVSGAIVSIVGKRNTTTDESGAFTFLVDRSLPQEVHLKIEDVEGATVEGKALEGTSKDVLKSTENAVHFYYPIRITEVKADPKDATKVEVHARAIADEDEGFPTTILDKYFIKGVVKDHTGAPVQGAVVSFTRDRGEGWSRSDPSNENGEYILYYSPEDDEDMFLNVFVGQVKYTLPENRVNRFPDETSVITDFILPETGTIIQDKPPTLVSGPAEGAVYWSRVIGLNVDPSVKYEVSLPEADGSFVVKIDKAEWEKSPHFYQTILYKLSEEELEAGDFIPSDWLPAPKVTDPKAIVAEAL
ncbi:carboxypeptidase-like regulatory domain-containing protein [Cohnella terricola]|uniref:Carboxypeptidase regulatory-like domain-containing protein n=1 Tax=Cohnella terricola TaxID=1289167 RepID=A0A559JKI9_9BACL|nr:carboxypeptidase-like regulatory domain-containing protein [Cohnella terricola]TVY00379.1 carboxypeptidase regulatory-like domain-containing protein [Cohnella terricola]